VERHRFLRRFSRWDPATSRPVPVEFDPARPSENALGIIYSDEALGTRFRDGLPSSSSTQPSITADMLEALSPAPGMRVLEIGTGTGYNAALLAEIVGEEGSVVTQDIDPGIAAEATDALRAAGYGSVRVVARDGAEGASEAAPFDRILVTVGCPDVSPRWQEQLTEDGRIVVPLEHAGLHPLVTLTKHDGGLGGRFFAWLRSSPSADTFTRSFPGRRPASGRVGSKRPRRCRRGTGLAPGPPSPAGGFPAT
jgi:protein-L-isoaspartate(D-aspartate) O-methyltransferase